MGKEQPQRGSRPILAAVQGQQKHIEFLKGVCASQQHQIEVLKLQLGYVANLAGISQHMDAIQKKADAEVRKQADVNNPGQPVPDPPSQAPSETTEEAVTPETMDDPRRPGQTPGSVSDVPADVTDLALNPGVSLPTSPYGNMVDVTAPVAGTETHVPLEQTRIETDVRVGDPMNPDTAFPWTISPNNSNGQPPASGEMAGRKANLKTAADVIKHLDQIDPSHNEWGATVPGADEAFRKHVQDNYPEQYDDYFQNHHRLPEWGRESAKTASKRPQSNGSRTLLAVKLARLQVQAGIAEGDDLAVAGSIEASAMTEASIRDQIDTLSKVQKAAARQQRPAGLVPKSASVGEQRTRPSLASGGVTAFANPTVNEDMADSDLFV